MNNHDRKTIQKKIEHCNHIIRNITDIWLKTSSRCTAMVGGSVWQASVRQDVIQSIERNELVALIVSFIES